MRLGGSRDEYQGLGVGFRVVGLVANAVATAEAVRLE